jgi:TPR repeat protein
MARANLLVAQGDVGAARNVLERAAETGNAAALFALAETHDPLVLSAWGTRGTQGDVAKAKELYARALTGGIAEAKHRLDALH